MKTLQIAVPDDVKEKVFELAEKQHVTIEQFMAIVLMEKLSTIPDPNLVRRADRGKRKDFGAFLDMAPDVPPDDYDNLE